ncbi:M1 family metallopeptidase [Maribacter algarum]|uniref:Aminopeptidase N n=1 Tax=Maribacter algarum (ex Zhang et al. 2020) TaxID=2578118 RepID=A0A5S3QI20_9FLAO|nr:M1 family metallopeptidase [Maribacter algarum]TMM57185.1 M1 family metallopeptidase [Maribacter algarum]
MNRLFLFLVFFGWMANAQHQDKVDFIRGEAFIKPYGGLYKITGSITYDFKVLESVDSVFIDAKNMDFLFINLNKKNKKYAYDGKKLIIKNRFKKGSSHQLAIRFQANPTQTLYHVGFDDKIKGNEQVWTQGQGKYTSHWLPSFDDMEEKIEFDLTLNGGSTLDVVANGELIGKNFGGHETFDWKFDMENPMSSYLLGFAISNYDKQELKSKSGIPIQNYYYPHDSLKVEPTYRHTKKIFDFIEQEIGYPYPWQNYKQVPVRDFLYAGMENTTCTIFSDQYVIDSTAFVDKNYVNVNAHELAHQWFGNLVTEKNGNHHWLHEGFATYYAQLAEKEVFGDDHYYWKLYKSLKQLEDVIKRGEGQALTNPEASSLIFYEKGAWALYMLRKQIGDIAFRKGIQNYLEKFKFKNVTIPDFIKEMETTSDEDLSSFTDTWLENESLPFEEAKAQLKKDSESLATLFKMEDEFQKAQSDDIAYVAYWEASNSIHLKKHILEQYQTSLPEEIYELAFSSDTIPIRQSLLSARDLPSYLDKEKLESLLEDKSYVTKENALFTLWRSYPKERTKYLDATKNITGLPNKNVRLLWLTLAMLSENYNSPQTKAYFDELSLYTNPQYGFEIRQSAFFYLKEAFGLNDESLTSLVKATEHHAWQFKKFARDLLKELLKDSEYKTRLEKLSTELNSKESRYLKIELNKT